MTNTTLPLIELLRKQDDGDVLRAVAEAVLQLLMEHDVEGVIGAARHERTEGRFTYRTGYRDRELRSRIAIIVTVIAIGHYGRNWRLAALLVGVGQVIIAAMIGIPPGVRMTVEGSVETALKRAAGLAIWTGPVSPEPLGGGLTNVNFVVEDAGRRYLVRIGDDIIEHQVMRFNELAASRAAHAAGISPAVVHHQPGILVLDFIEAVTLDEAAVRDPAMLERIVPLIRRCHHRIPEHLRGPVLMFWVFHVLRDYAGTLRDGDSPHGARLASLMAMADELQQAVGPVDVVFGHNDLLCANFLDDGERLWLIDWDYAGFNSPLFDLGGLASNNGLTGAQERWLLETYFETALTDALWRSYQAMKCASLMRETMWSMVSEIHSKLDFDYAAYTRENLARFEAAYDAFRTM